MEKTNSKQKETKQKDSGYNRVVVCQMIFSVVILALIVFLCRSSGEAGLKNDYRALMQWDISEKALETVMSVKQYFSGENMWAVESASVTLYESDTTEQTTSNAVSETENESTNEAETTEEVTENATTQQTDIPSGGVDLEVYEATDNTSFAPIKATSQILNPIENPRYTSFFGYRISPITGKRSFHTGIDIAAPLGTKIRAAYSGKVTKVGEDSRAGKYIFLTHDDGFVTFYCHCSEILAEEDANIRQGETIAKVGSTGWSTGPHLHFEVRKDGIRLNPMWLLEDDCTK